MNKIIYIFIIGLLGCGQPSISLKNFHTCEATIIGNTDDAIVIYAKTIDLCGEKKIIALEKFEYRDSSGMAHFQIVDTVRINLINDQILATTYCKDRKTPNIILGTDASQDNFGQIIKSWTYNENRTKLIEIDPMNLNCLNEDLIE